MTAPETPPELFGQKWEPVNGKVTSVEAHDNMGEALTMVVHRLEDVGPRNPSELARNEE